MRRVGIGAKKSEKKNEAETKLKKEIKDLKTENEKLKVENDQLKAELQK